MIRVYQNPKKCEKCGRTHYDDPHYYDDLNEELEICTDCAERTGCDCCPWLDPYWDVPEHYGFDD